MGKQALAFCVCTLQCLTSKVDKDKKIDIFVCVHKESRNTPVTKISQPN